MKKLCQWYVSMEQPVCAAEATEEIRVKTRLVDVKVNVCPIHKARYNDAQMRARHNAKTQVHRG